MIMIGEDFSFYLFFLLSVWVGKEGRKRGGWMDGSMNGWMNRKVGGWGRGIV